MGENDGVLDFMVGKAKLSKAEIVAQMQEQIKANHPQNMIAEIVLKISTFHLEGSHVFSLGFWCSALFI